MPDKNSTPRASDDLETAQRKSKTVDERVPEPQSTDAVPELELPGAITRGGPIGTETPGPGEIALERESKARREPTVRG